MKKTHKMKRMRILNFVVLLIILLCNTTKSFSQEKTVLGTVLDKMNQPIIGASINLKGTSKGTITDLNGNFTISAPLNSVLVVSYIGMLTKSVKVDKQKIQVVLEASAQSLEEVVVVGYGQTAKKDLTGSTSRINMNEVIKAPTASITDALGGRIAGLSVSSNDGQPGIGANIVIRGANSLTGDNSPLYVIDGFPLENANLGSIPSEDIESIDVLKDASATAIYGSRGANGVILITTKKGKNGRTIVTYDQSYGMQNVTKRMELMGAYDFLKMSFEFDPTTTTNRYFTNGRTIDSYIGVKGLDFQDAILQKAPIQSKNLAIRGGNENTTYSISFNSMDQNGVLINGGFNRNQGRIKLDHKINKFISIGTNIDYSQIKTYGVVPASPSDNGFNVSTYLMSDVWGYRPISTSGETDSLLNEDRDPNDSTFDLRFNPVVNAQNSINDRLTNILNSNAYIEYNFLPKFKLRLSGGINKFSKKSSDFYNSRTKLGNNFRNERVNGQIIFDEKNTWLSENIISYNNKFKSGHKINATTGFTVQGETSSSFGAKSILLPFESLGLSGMDLGTPQTVKSVTSSWNLASFLGRINYDFKSKYLLTMSFRADGSSKFSPQNKWGYFPSGSFAWRASQENFIKKSLPTISDLKFRTSWGITGNNRVGDFASLAQMNGTYYYNGFDYSAVIPTALANTNLRWENTTQTNLGIDLGLFEQRISLTVDAYRKITSDLLLNSQLPGSSGFTSSIKNIGKVQNQGLEFTLNTINVRTTNFEWSSNFNISFNRNKVLELAENQYSFTTQPGTSFSPTSYVAMVGKPIGQMLGYVYDGLYQYNNFDLLPNGTYILKNDVPSNSPSRTTLVQPGYIKYKDLNNDGVINSNDLTIIGNPIPVHVGGFSNSFSYKGIDLNVFFQWSYGNDIYNANRDVFESSRLKTQFVNKFATFADRWRPDNLDATLPVTKGTPDGDFENPSTRVVEDGSFLRLKTVSLGYTLPTNIINKIGMTKLRIYASAQNLYTWTKYSGFDPEVSSSNSQLTPGFDFSTYPRASTLTFGVNAQF
jgi:TonB-linked SusC/RagA family outer membrane protein